LLIIFWSETLREGVAKELGRLTNLHPEVFAQLQQMAVGGHEVVCSPLEGTIQKFVVIGVLHDKGDFSGDPNHAGALEEFLHLGSKPLPRPNLFQNRLDLLAEARGEDRLALTPAAEVDDVGRGAPRVKICGDERVCI